MSPTSSRKIVPPSASTNLPICLRTAPVKEPFSWPKSSDSISSSGIAAQLTCTNGPAATRDVRWISRATSSLPVPLSPRMSTVALVGAARATSARSRFIGSLSPRRTDSTSTRRLSSWFSARRRLPDSALRTETRTRSRWSGFSRKSTAPRRVHSMAVAMSPCPEIMSTGGAPSRATMRSRVSRPSRPGILMSRSTAAAGDSSSASRAARPSPTVATSYPSYSRTIRRVSRIAASSSTTRIL